MITKEMIGLPIQKYRPKVDNSHNKTSRQKAIEIYNYIASRPAYIRRSGSTYRSEENDKTYIDLIEERVEKNEPIEIFFLGYCSKYTNEDLTNNQIYPDMGNLISFVHLLTIAENLSKIYPPGIKFDVALETDIYRSLGKHTTDETKKVNEILKQLLEEAEKLTGVYGKIELVNTMDLVESMGQPFLEALKEEKEKVEHEYQNGENKQRIDEWIEFYKTTTSKDMFPNEDVAHDYAMQQAIFYEAFNRIKYNQLKDSRFLENGIAHDFSKAIMATTRGTKEKATLQIFPKESHFPHHGICTIDKNGRWRISRYSDIQNSETGYYIPRFHEQYDFPFYYEELSREIPDHDLNSLKCHTQIATMRDGQKVVLKFSTENHEDGTQILTKEIDRIKEMKNKGIKIVPDVIYTKQDTDTNVAYVMEYIDGKTLEEVLLKKPELTIEEFKEILNHFLNTLSTEMYDVGISEKSEDYIKRIHGGRIQDIKNTDNIKINTINGTNVLTPTEMVNYLEENYDEIEKTITTGIVPTFTHGDLHFRNIIQEKDNQKFRVIDLNGRRPINTIETEMSRLLLSFDAYIIRHNLIDVNISVEGDATIKYSEEAKRILALKEQALKTIIENQNISKWFNSKEQAISQIKLLEAVHILGVHSKRNSEQQLPTYLLGTHLMNEAIEQIKELEKERTTETNDEVIIDVIKQLKENPEDKETYKNVYREYFKKLSKDYQDFAFISQRGTWYIRLTDNNGKRIVKCLEEDAIEEFQGEKNSNGLIEYSDEEFMLNWQQTNFPKNSPDLITKTYSEKRLWESMFSGKEVEIAGKKYIISDIAGIGKESKAFITKSGEIIKIGQQSLKLEYDYSKKLEKTNFSDKFPQYYGYDSNTNCVVMELCEGKTADELIRNAKTEEEKLAVLRVIFDSIKTECGLYNQNGIYTGQFNLRNIIINGDTFKIIDPFYEGEADLYEPKQLFRMTAILPQRLAKNDKEVGNFPLKVKSAQSKEEMASLRYPEEALKKFKEVNLDLPRGLEEKIKGITEKYLSGEITSKSMTDLEEDMAFLYALTTICKNKVEKSKMGIVFDINGTIEHNGKFSDETVRTINEIASRGIPIACITGKNEERAMQVLSKMGIDMSKIALYTQNGAMCYQNGEIIYERDLPSNVRNNVKAMLPSEQDILVREDNCRVNVVSTDDEIALQTIERLKNVRGIEIVTSSNGHEIEILPENINKFYALRDFAKRNNLAPSCVIRIGNEPYGNDNSILNTDSSLIIEGEKQCEAIFKALAESLTKGAIQISKDIKLDERFCLKDFQYIPSEQLEELSEYAQSVAKDFYPAFAIKQRLSEEDIKRLDYKWAICDGKKPIGFTFAYEINKSGVYNVGMYMLPEYTGNGIGSKTMNQIFEFGKNQIYGFKGIRERVVETNKPSRKLLEKCGFSIKEIKPNDYVLYDSQGKEYKNNTVVYERNIDDNEKRLEIESGEKEINS